MIPENEVGVEESLQNFGAELKFQVQGENEGSSVSG
jgi:hypothetical protein